MQQSLASDGREKGGTKEGPHMYSSREEKARTAARDPSAACIAHVIPACSPCHSVQRPLMAYQLRYGLSWRAHIEYEHFVIFHPEAR